MMTDRLKRIKQWSIHRWKQILMVLIPLVTIPLNFVEPRGKASRCLYLTVNLFSFWSFNIMPAELIGILPLVLFPLFGVNSTQEVCSYYLNTDTFLLLSSMFVGVAMETTGLNVRIGRKILLLTGTQLSRIGAAILFPALLLSIFIPCTFVAILSLSVVNATMTALRNHDFKPKVLTLQRKLNSAVSLTDIGLASDIWEEDCSTSQRVPDEQERRRKHHHIKICLVLCTGYVTWIGSTAMLTTPINAELNQIFHKHYNETELTHQAWAGCSIPTLLICSLMVWLYFYWSNVYFSTYTDETCIMKSLKSEDETEPRMTVAEKFVLITLTCCSAVLFSLDPGFVEGWSYPTLDSIAPATPVAFLALLYFATPANPLSLFKNDRFNYHGGHKKRIIDYRWAFQSIPWSAFIIQGASNALGHCVETSGLSDRLSNSIPQMVNFSLVSLVMIMGIIGTGLSQFLPNNHAIAMILPGIIKLAQEKKTNPLFLAIPATLSSSYAFIFPVANHVNSAIFTLGKLKHSEMVKPGLVLNILCFVVVNVMVNTLTIAVFDLYDFPSWANLTSTDFYVNTSRAILR